MKSLLKLAIPAIVLLVVAAAQADVIANWTFETTTPAAAGPFNPEIGAGSALGFHAGTSTYSSPAGNGSSHSFSSTNWAVGDYYQFQASTSSLQNIAISFDQTSSNTGPKDFQLEYSTDGTNFFNVGSYYSVLANASPNTPWTATGYNAAYTFTYDCSAITNLNNQATVYFRVADYDTVSANGGVVASGGTDRLDNVVISTVPEPLTVSLLLAGGLMGIIRRRS